MENRRRQSGVLRQRIEIGRIDLAVQPMLKADATPFGLADRAMADAVNAITPISQPTNEMPTDKAIGAGNPYVHAGALRQTNE